jgi:hypothetical protein
MPLQRWTANRQCRNAVNHKAQERLPHFRNTLDLQTARATLQQVGSPVDSALRAEVDQSP